MPVYQGGKSRIGKKIHHIINLIETELHGLILKWDTDKSTCN